MRRITLDTSIERKQIGEFTFPLGVFPVEEMTPISGYMVEFEPADGPPPVAAADTDEEWEEWPDRFMYDISISAARLRPLCQLLISLLPPKVFPILDVLGRDAFREIDPYIAYETVGLDKFHEGLFLFEDWLFEDGLVGFGAMSVEPFFYFFVDEHKIITVRAQLDLKEKLEKILAAFELAEVSEVAGADSVAHEHQTILASPESSKDSISPEEILDWLRDTWQLELNVDPTTNVDEKGVELGLTGWDCIVRCRATPEAEERYANVLLTAGSLEQVEELISQALSDEAPPEAGWLEMSIIRADRLKPEEYTRVLGQPEDSATPTEAKVDFAQWLEDGEDKPAENA